MRVIHLNKVNNTNRPDPFRNNAEFIKLITDLHRVYSFDTGLCYCWCRTYRLYDIFQRILKKKWEWLPIYLHWTERRFRSVESVLCCIQVSWFVIVSIQWTNKFWYRIVIWFSHADNTWALVMSIALNILFMAYPQFLYTSSGIVLKTHLFFIN